ETDIVRHIVKEKSIISCIRNHHERWDGNGYPNGKKGAKIPLMARIVSVVDTFDALTSRRPYKDPYPIDISCEIIKKERGRQFDPEIVDIFVKNIDDFVNIKKEIDVMDPATNTSKIILSDRDKEWDEKSFVL
ncbi:MAG: HD domain-containing protein, partial [Chitinispirillaceae bacterium]|nr:HD domain-containing protein [Chitinispirillaceae bacterium]